MILEILNSKEAQERELHVYQKFAYAPYAKENTTPDIGIQESHAGSIVRYIILSTDDPIMPRDLDPEAPHRKYLEELKQFSKMLGFMSLEIGPYTEANLLVNKSSWPQVHTYVGDLAIHGYLSKELKQNVQKRLWKEAFSIIGIIPAYILTIDKVLKFARTTGHIFTLEQDASLNLESPQVKEYTTNWVGYWNKGPKLYQVTKGK